MSQAAWALARMECWAAAGGISPWFCAFSAVAAVAATWLFAMAFLRRSIRRARQQALAQARERERRYSELNDSIQQGAQGLVLSVQAFIVKLPVDDSTRRDLERVLDEADEVMAQARDSILDLHLAASTAMDLHGRLRSVVDELSADGAVAISLSTTGAPRALRDDARDAIHRVAREALLNAYRHAGARRIEVRLGYESTRFRLLVGDDGRGIDARALASDPGRWGLAGLRERAARIDGTLAVDGEAGQGTRVRLDVPAARAYIDGRRSLIRRILRLSKDALLGREESDHAED